MIKSINFSFVSQWCDSHNFPWIIKNNALYWKTHIQTGEVTSQGKIIWHNHDYFNKIIES